MRNLSLLLVASSLLIATSVSQPESPVLLTILHTNDMHARYLPREATWVNEEPRPLIGGMVRLAELIDSVRSEQARSVTLDAGDIMTGNPICDLPYKGVMGGLLMEMMNRIKYDAWSPGNHEFDISQANLQGLIRAADFPSLSANLADSTGAQYDGTRPYTVITRGGLRIGIVGLMSQRLSSLVLQRNIAGIRVLDPVATLDHWIRELDPVTDVLIALTHQGYEEDSVLAEQVQGLDIIVGGHSHTRLRHPRTVNGVVIVQAGSYCENLGVLTLRVADDRVQSFEGSMVPLWVSGSPAGGPLAQLVDSVRTVVDQVYGEVIATLPGPLRRWDSQQRLAIAVTEAQRQAAAAEVSFMNRGGIRRDLQQGPVTRNDVYEVLPFRNVLGTFQLSGSQLRDVVSYMIDADPDVIVTGLTAEWRERPGEGGELLRVAVGGITLEDDRAYRCVASDYFLGQFKRYCGIEAPPASYSEVTLFDAVEQALGEDGFLEQLPAPALSKRD